MDGNQSIAANNIADQSEYACGKNDDGVEILDAPVGTVLDEVCGDAIDTDPLVKTDYPKSDSRQFTFFFALFVLF